MNRKALILNLLMLVPEPHVRAVGSALKLVLAAKAAAAEEPIDVDTTVDEAVAEALEPWRRIKARADAEASNG